MKYINPYLFIHGEDTLKSKKYCWVLLGEPTNTSDSTNLYPLADTQETITPQLITDNTVASAPYYYFKDCNIAGVSGVAAGSAYFGITATNTASSIVYAFNQISNLPVDARVFPRNYLDSQIALYNGYKVTNGLLCLVELKDTVTRNVEDVSTILDNTFVAAINDYFETVTTNSTQHMRLKKTAITGRNFFDSFVERIMFAYSISTTDLVNNYNYAGFAVGTTTVTVNGLTVTESNSETPAGSEENNSGENNSNEENNSKTPAGSETTGE